MAARKTKFQRVTATMVVVKVSGAQGGETYMRRGRRLPDTVDKAEVKRLLDLGLIESVEVEVEDAGDTGSTGTGTTPPGGTPPAEKTPAGA